ncbi:MAG: restriction endonuclease [Gammaproteobacteria bacterium]|nr:MAG: restriction endonuclease [Gammaproteobacteria bacterium]
MNLLFDTELSKNYKSNSQIARVLTEDWVLKNSYCPSCGNVSLDDYENNRPVADFFCQECDEEFELKSKKGTLSKTITDGAYKTMIERINANSNPNFFFLTYSKDWSVNHFLIIPKHFFTQEIIIKRPPLAPSAKRAGWVGCNIDISNVPDTGRIFLVRNKVIADKKTVTSNFNKTLFIRDKNLESKGWIIEVLKCVDAIKSDVFTLSEIYQFEPILQQKYPNNHFIKDKIRQQLQFLRDKGLIEFVCRGKYRKVM